MDQSPYFDTPGSFADPTLTDIPPEPDPSSPQSATIGVGAPDLLEINPHSDSRFEPSRKPAYSMEAEQSVLGALLLDNSVMDQLGDILAPEDFYVGAHRLIYQSAIAMLERGEPVDAVTLKQYLEKHDTLASVGGIGYLAHLVDTVPTAANARAYARMVHDRAVIRELAHQTTQILEKIHGAESFSVNDLLDDAEQRIFSVSERNEQRRSDYSAMKPIIMPLLARIESLMGEKNPITGIPTGYMDMDLLTAGLQPSDLIIVAGRPSMGKTALALNFAANAALRHQIPVGIFSLEMSKEQLVARMLASEARVDAQQMRTGRISADDYGKVGEAADKLSTAPIFVDDTPALSIMAMRAKARRLQRERGVRLLIVDYLQLMRGSHTENRVQEISEISQGLKAIAKELRLPVVALSQLSRQVESRTDKRPILSDLRESGSIEQDADIVMFVYREEYYKKDDPKLAGMAEAIFAKQRNGPTGSVRLTFLHKYTRFENYIANPEYDYGNLPI